MRGVNHPHVWYTGQTSSFAAIKAAGQEHNTLGGIFEVWAFDALPGLGSHVSGDARLDGRFGQALNFDGVNDRVAIPDASVLDLTTGMMTRLNADPCALCTLIASHG